MDSNLSSNVRLVQFTDCHLFGDPNGRLRGTVTLDSLQATVAAAQARVGHWDATLLTGDLVQDDPAGYAHFHAVFAALPQTVYCIPGNHDEPASMRRALARAPFSHARHADLGNWRIVLLDSRVAGSAQGALSDAELAALEEALGTAGERHVLIALHHHPVVMVSRWLDQVGLTNEAALFAIVDRYPKVRALVFGHVHQEYSGERRGVRLYGTPSTCAQFRPRVDHFAIDAKPPAFRTLELGADGSVMSTLQWVDPGEALREAQIA